VIFSDDQDVGTRGDVVSRHESGVDLEAGLQRDDVGIGVKGKAAARA